MGPTKLDVGTVVILGCHTDPILLPVTRLQSCHWAGRG